MKPLARCTGSPPIDEAIARLWLDARSLSGGRAYQRFLIVGVARTGSTLLLNLLNAHPRVLAFGELFHGDGAIGWDTPPFLTRQSARLRALLETEPLRFLETAVFRRWPAQVQAVGFKMFYYHARSGAPAAVWTHLRDMPDLAIIHIKRRNILEQHLSLKLAHATNVWSVTSPPAAPGEPIRLDPEECRRHFEKVRGQETDCDAFFAGRRVLTLDYEDLVADRTSAMERVAVHLGVPARGLEARVVRQRVQPLAQAIANYDELRASFTGSPWESFFRDGETARRQAA